MQPLVGYRRHLEAGEVLYHAGAKCSLMHVVQAGFFKTIMLSEDGIAQITGFQMPGDVLGVDGLSSGVHRCDAIALTEASVCVVSRARLLQSTTENDALCLRLLDVLSDEILSDHSTMLLLGSRSAEERVAGFIVELSERLSARGYSGSEIGLWMTREEIGRFLGLELETVSRVLSSLLKRRLIEVHRRHLRIVDLDALRAVVIGPDGRGHRRTSHRGETGAHTERMP
jgi:CRP/FNR family transcriptional regulator